MILLIFLYGIIIGSFLNVCIYRVPIKQTVITKPSHCTNCSKPILKRDLIPILSYLMLKGRCRFCGIKISIRYVTIEILNGLVYILLYYMHGLSVQFIGYALLSSTLIVISFIDFDFKIVPPKIVILILIMGSVFNIFNQQLTLMDSVIGFFAVSIPLLIIALASNGGIGVGDIKLMAVTGIYLGWKLILLSLFIASIIGGIAGIVLIVFKIRKLKDKIAFVPFLSLGMFIAMLYGQQIIQWYIKLIQI